jgi:hypothetical protein
MWLPEGMGCGENFANVSGNGDGSGFSFSNFRGNGYGDGCCEGYSLGCGDDYGSEDGDGYGRGNTWKEGYPDSLLLGEIDETT